ncbi:branched-chain amino acid ABC transporter permease [Paracoccus sp. (in: a-proteobacteria)]|uniref:branched-chain amino acid ABC transporter permease n=1 Tax=Paracoccus sp. TaxID=267 RepID=UPI002897FB57|nr:branched-chain amino acid ABC transporter permease [Paracoccus sp. (in: a-proteobacteria)]
MTFRRETLLDLSIFALLVAVALIASLLGQSFTVTLATKVAILGMAGVGLNLALGYGGLVSFGHAAFFGIGGYVTAILASHAANYEPLIIGFEGTNQMLAIWPFAIAVAGLAGLVIGALSLRTSGVYFIMVTLAFAQMLYYLAVSWPAYGGEDGLSFYTRNSFPGLNTFDPLQFFAICAGLLAIVLLASHRLTLARFGLALMAARQSPARSAAVGIRPYAVQLVAFVISAMICGLAGALYAELNRFVSPASMSWHMSGEIMVFVILGGVGRLAGPIAGAAVYILLEQILGPVSDYWLGLVGLLLLMIVLFAPGGLSGLILREKRHD